jgi:H+-translocating NAD(P) transhydrogenase subunit alpha
LFLKRDGFSRPEKSQKYAGFSPRGQMNSTLIDSLFIFMLACFIGFEVIRHVSPLLHTPLMSLTNALDAIAVIGAIVMVGERKSEFSTVLGVIAIVAATSNVVGGFFITDRMLKMFKTSRPVKK